MDFKLSKVILKGETMKNLHTYYNGVKRLSNLFIKNWPHHRIGKCNVCGEHTLFFCDNLKGMRGSMACLSCYSVSRNRHVAKIIMDTFGVEADSLKDGSRMLKTLKIYNTSTKGALNKVLSTLPNYVCSEYIDGVKPGTKSQDGILCEDLQHLSFSDNSFDLVITEDIFEHIRHPEKGWGEIRRVLKPGGYHIFTIPFAFEKSTFNRVDTSTSTDIYVVPPRYHGDPLRNEGILVYNDFGVDLFEQLETFGFKTDVFINNYSDAHTQKIYESYVFRSKLIGE